MLANAIIRLRADDGARLTLSERVDAYAAILACRTPAVRGAVERYVLETATAHDRPLMVRALTECVTGEVTT